MNRRHVIGLLLSLPLIPRRSLGFMDDGVPTSRFERILQAARQEHWNTLPIGKRMINIATFFMGVPYVGGTLETQPEVCTVNLEALDCVTFFEVVLNIARMIDHHGSTFEDLVNEVTYTRYRQGKLNGYVSRLHYTAEWIADNIEKNVIHDVTPDMGGEPFPVNVNFMSSHPKFYKPLQDHPELVEAMAAIERHINTIPRTYIPKEKIADAEHLMQQGDIIAITTSKAGLDYAHTGLINRSDGKARFMHASTTHKKVVLDDTIGNYVLSVKSHTGISVLRPVVSA